MTRHLLLFNSEPTAHHVRVCTGRVVGVGSGAISGTKSDRNTFMAARVTCARCTASAEYAYAAAVEVQLALEEMARR
jgi:hypothetical protein